MNYSRAVQSPPAAVEEALARLGGRLRIARLRRNLTTEELASRIGLSRQTVSSVERGRPGVSAAAVFGTLWALRLLDDLEPVAAPALDAEGSALELARGRKRARPRRALDDDF